MRCEKFCWESFSISFSTNSKNRNQKKIASYRNNYFTFIAFYCIVLMFYVFGAFLFIISMKIDLHFSPALVKVALQSKESISSSYFHSIQKRCWTYAQEKKKTRFSPTHIQTINFVRTETAVDFFRDLILNQFQLL